MGWGVQAKLELGWAGDWGSTLALRDSARFGGSGEEQRRDAVEYEENVPGRGDGAVLNAE